MAGVVGLVFALAGSAVAASGRSATRDSTVQACIATQDTVHRVTGGVDQATGGLTSPLSQIANAIVGGVNQGTDGALSDITESVAPASSVLIVPSGTPCPSGYAAQTLTAPAAVDLGRSTGSVALAKSKVPVAMTDVTAAGPYMVTATVDIAETGLSDVAQTVKCTLVDGPNMQTIPGTTSTGTFPVDSSGAALPLTIDSYLPDVPTGELAVDCKDPQLAATTSRSVQIKRALEVTADQCQGSNGHIQNGKCYGSFIFPGNGLTAIKPGSKPTPPKPPTATGNIQATSAAKPAGISSFTCNALSGKVVNGQCMIGGFAYAPVTG